jgi:hypothetical protein
MEELKIFNPNYELIKGRMDTKKQRGNTKGGKKFRKLETYIFMKHNLSTFIYLNPPTIKKTNTSN